MYNSTPIKKANTTTGYFHFELMTKMRHLRSYFTSTVEVIHSALYTSMRSQPIRGLRITVVLNLLVITISFLITILHAIHHFRKL